MVGSEGSHDLPRRCPAVRCSGARALPCPPAIDLDLDVIRRVDGTCEIVDRDEFEDHQVVYGYPQDIIERADAAADEALDLLTRHVPPFDRATMQKWVASVS